MVEWDFSAILPLENTNFHNDPRVTVPLYKSRSPGKFQHIAGAKSNLRLDALKKVRGTVSLYLCYLSLEAAQLSEKRDLSACDFPHRGKREYVSEHPASPDVWDIAQEAHFFLLLPRFLRCVAWHGLQGVAGWMAARVDVSWIWIILTTLQSPSRNPFMNPWGHLTYRSSNLAYRHPQHSTCLSHIHCYSMASCQRTLPRQ